MNEDDGHTVREISAGGTQMLSSKYCAFTTLIVSVEVATQRA